MKVTKETYELRNGEPTKVAENSDMILVHITLEQLEQIQAEFAKHPESSESQNLTGRGNL